MSVTHRFLPRCCISSNVSSYTHSYHTPKRHASIQSQHSSFDDTTTVHPLRNLLLRIRNELDPEVVHQLICLSRKQLQDQFESVLKEYDLLDFFNALEARYGTENAAKYIETLLEYDHLHGDCGQLRLAGMVQQYREEKAEYMVKCQEKGIPLDPYFVGRDQILSEVIQHLKKPSSGSKGVLICGQNGVGKSSLAREVCYRLKNDTRQWQITLVNLRERTMLKELMHALLLQLANDRWRLDLDVTTLKSELLHAIKGQARSRNIIWLDNVDELCYTQEKWGSLIKFLGDISNIMDQEKDCQMKIIVTVAETSGKEYFADVLIHALEDAWKFVHLSDLSSDDSELLLQKLSNRSLEAVQTELLYLATHGNPLALRMLRILFQDGKPVSTMENAVHADTPLGSPSFQEERCTEQSFQALDKSSQSLLVKLSVFRTGRFDLETAIFVTSADRKILEQAKHLNEKKYDLLVNLNHLRICNFIEEEEESEVTNLKTSAEKKTKHRFSLHPLICSYLLKNQSSGDFIEDSAQAKLGFCIHFCSVMNKFVRKYDSSETEAAKSIWKENDIHFKTWFHYVAGECLPVDRFCENSSYCKPLQIQARIWRVAQTMLSPSEQLGFLQQQTKLANQSKSWFSAVVWISLQAEYHVNHNEVEIAEQLMNGLPEEYFSFAPRITSDTLNADQNLAQTDEMFINVAEMYSQEQQLGVLVASAFYYSTCGYILKQGGNIKTSRNYLRLARKLFSGKYGKPDIQKQIKQSYKFEHSKIEHWLTMLKRQQFHESQNPHHCRQSTASSNSSADLDSIYSNTRESCSSTEIQECCLLLNESSSSRQQAWISASSNRKIPSRDSQALSSCSDTSWRDSYDSTGSFGHDSLEIMPGLSSKARRRKSVDRLESQASVTSLMDKLQTNIGGSWEQVFAEDLEMQTDTSDQIHIIKRKKTDE